MSADTPSNDSDTDLPTRRTVPETMPSHDLATLLKVSTALATSLELTTVLQVAVESAVEVLGLQTGAIYTLEDETLCLGATTPPLPDDFPSELRLAPLADHIHVTKCLTTGEPIFVSNAGKATFTPAERIAIEQRGLCSILYVPLICEDSPIGTVIVGSQACVRELTPHQIDLCRTLAAEISLAVANANLYTELHRAHVELSRAYDDTIIGWADALEMRDHETHGHAERVTDLTLELAQRLGMHDGDLPNVRRGAFLHDIGKMIVPDAVLNKPGPLNEEEWAIMRAHPVRAYDLLSRIDYLLPALDIPYCHHERWDGTGYPRGLAGEDIPLPARIFAVIDVWDALTSDRPYRSAWTPEEALDHIREQAGSHFDPIVVAAFLQVMRAPV